MEKAHVRLVLEPRVSMGGKSLGMMGHLTDKYVDTLLVESDPFVLSSPIRHTVKEA